MSLQSNRMNQLIEILNSYPPEILWVILFVACYGFILLMLRFFGAAGIYVYIGLAIIGANIQVLKAVQFSVYDKPIALGTLLFTSTFLCTDILTEFYGPKAARKGVYLGFMAMLIMTALMIIALGFNPLDINNTDPDFRWAAENHDHMLALFIPAPALFVAGMIAYLVSQLNDVWVYNFIKKITQGRFLWLRNNASTWVATFIDNSLFSILAWIVLSDSPLPWHVVWGTYILGTYGFRVVIAILDTPVLYLSKYCLPKDYNKEIINHG